MQLKPGTGESELLPAACDHRIWRVSISRAENEGDNEFMEQTFLVKIAGEEPEKFALLTFDWAKGSMTHMSGAMSEKELRDHLGGNGMPEPELDGRIAAARQKPM
jgi:hypothetical protein